jgi:3-phenylpropionate/trans-cinnamate dioxygenase ferredoxin reductase subunit
VTERGVVIVGAGQGGFQAAASLRQEGYEGPVTLVGDEPGLPYQRPPLSKAYLKDGDADRLNLRPAAFYETARIEVLTGVRAARIDREGRSVELTDGRNLRWDRLVLATGSRNRSLPIPGAGLGGVAALRTLADARALRERMPGVSRAIVIGGGFIGLEFAAVARGLGVEVTVLEAAPRAMSRVVSEATSGFFHALHRELGTDLRLESAAAGILSDDGTRASGVRLADGTEVAGNLVVIAVGIVPNVELAEAAGLACANGIVVDAELRTSDPDVFAIGDCVSFVPHGRSDRLRLESVQNAVDGARAVAATIAGRPTPLTAVPWFWSDQAQAKLQIAGLAHDADGHEVVNRGEGKLCVFCFREGRLVGVETVNSPADHMAARKLLGVRNDLTAGDLRGVDWRLKELIQG